MDATLKLKAEQLAGDIAAQAQTLDDLNGLLRTLMKSALERMLDTEMDVHLGRKTIAALPPVAIEAGDQAAPANRRNGRSKKTVRGEAEVGATQVPPLDHWPHEAAIVGASTRQGKHILAAGPSRIEPVTRCR
jgi:hypothetical protein